MARQDEPGRSWEALHYLVEKLGAVHPGHAHVRNYDVKGMLADALQGFDATIYEFHVPLVAHRIEHALETLENEGFVVNKQDIFHLSWQPESSPEEAIELEGG